MISWKSSEFLTSHSLSKKKKKKSLWTDLRDSSLQFGLSSPADSSFTPESCSMLWLRSSSLRWEGLDLSAETTTLHWTFESEQPESLPWHIYTKIQYSERGLYINWWFSFFVSFSDDDNLTKLTHSAFLQFLTAVISLCCPRTVVLYFFTSNSSRTSSDICSM